MSTVYLFKEISSHGALFNALSCLLQKVDVSAGFRLD